MKRIVQAVFLLVCALALGSAIYFLIQERTGAAAAARPIATRQIVVDPSSSPTSPRSTAGTGSALANSIPALPNEVILNVTSINIDQEEGDEQILTVRRTDKVDSPLSIVVASSGARVWEGDTLATKPTTFSIQARDFLGNHGIQIACTGMDDSDEQTIDLFQRAPGTSSPVYVNILSLAADSIVVGDSDRSEGYQLGQANGESWPIYAYSRDKDSANVLDQVKDKYSWDPKAGRYAKTGSERIPGAQVERETVSKILTGSEADFEAFLQGVWYDASKSPLDPKAKLILFDKDSGSISFYRPEAQEIYTWTESHSIRNGLYVRCQNESVEDLVRLMDIELTGSDLVSIRVFEDLQMKADPEDRWDGSFRKLPRDLPRQVAGESQGPAAGGLGRPAMKLEGPYRDSGGTELSFAQPRYSLKTSAATESGGFELYSLGQDTVLDLIAIPANGLPSARRTYKVGYSEIKVGKDLLRRLKLSPAKAAIDGLELLQEEDLILEQRVKGSG